MEKFINGVVSVKGMATILDEKESLEKAVVRFEAGVRQYILGADTLRQIAVLGNTRSGHTFLVEDQLGGKEVLKLLSYRLPAGVAVQEHIKSIQLFERESSVLSKLDHGQIAKMRRRFVTEHEGELAFYFTQEYFAGQTLEQMVKEKGLLAPREAVKMILSLL